jgi:hypothetical protein
VWAANPHIEHAQYEQPNLIISPFHPSSWPFLIRLRIVLENRKGALADAARLLEENDLSVVFAECTPTGFTHATWTVIAESTRAELDDLRVKKERFDWDHPTVRITREKGHKEARVLANSIAARMLSHVRKLEGVFEGVVGNQAREEGRSPLLHVWSADGDDHFLYNGDEVAKEMEKSGQGTFDANLDYIRSQVPRPFQIRYIQRLAYFSIYGGGEREEVPFKFQYNAGATLIEMMRGFPFGEGSFNLSPLPMPAIGTFNSEDKYLRLCPVTHKFLNRPLTRISMDYEVKQQKHDAKASQGLLRRVCDEIRADVDLLHISNKWTRHGYSNEEGEISFIADVDPADHVGLAAKLRAINDEGKRERLPAVTIKDARVYNYPQKKLFFSIHFGHPRENCIIEMVERAARAEGFVKVVVVKTHTGPVTEAIGAEMKTCQAFLQMLYLNRVPLSSDALNWLNQEYTMAWTMGMSTIRLIDTSSHSHEQWKAHLRINTDQPLKDFRIDLSDEDLGAQIHDAIKELVRAPGRKS